MTTLILLGHAALREDGSEYALRVPVRALEVLALLALTRGPVRRSLAAQLVWPEASEREALANLRRNLYTLSRSLPGHAQNPWFASDTLYLQWKQSPAHAADVAQFAGYCEANDAVRAIECYGGDLLPESYAEWIIPHRDGLRARAKQMFALAMRGADGPAALHIGERSLALDPLDESSVRAVMELRIAEGDRAGALALYRTFAQRSLAELGAPPSEQTAAIAAQAQIQAAPRNPIPRTEGSMFGRHAEMERALRLLEERALVTLVGPGGVGKTRLALETASRVAAGYAHAWFVDLSELDAGDDDAVAETVRRAAGAPVFCGDATRDIAGFVDNDPSLIVLDNCEHVRKGAAALVFALRACPRVRVLATSRRVLGIPGEERLAVAPLGRPDSVRLFEERANGVNSGFSISSGNVHLVEEIVTQLDGLPLAIELAAARAGILTLEDIANRTKDGLALLRRSAGNGRHSTLTHTVAWSARLLPASEFRLLSVFAVFAGDADLEALQTLWGAGDPKADVFIPLRELIEVSLVDARAVGGTVRYGLHTAVRHYLRETNGAPERSLQRSHAAYYAGRLAAAAAAAQTHGAAAYLARVRTEYANMMEALRFYVAERDFAQAAALCSDMRDYWDRAGGAGAALVLVNELLAQAGGQIPAALLRVAGFLENAQGNWKTAIRLNEQAATAYESHGERSEAIRARLGAVHARSYAGEPLSKTIAAFEDAFVEFRALDDRVCAADVAANLGAMYCSSGDLGRASERLMFALSVFAEMRFVDRSANALRVLARTYRDEGNHPRAEAFARESAQIFTDLGDDANAADALRICAQSARARGDIHASYLDLAQTLTLLERSYDPRFATYALVEASRVLRALGDLQSAARAVGLGHHLQRRHGTAKEAVRDESVVRELAADLGDAFEPAFASGSLMRLAEVRSRLEIAFSGIVDA